MSQHGLAEDLTALTVFVIHAFRDVMDAQRQGRPVKTGSEERLLVAIQKAQAGLTQHGLQRSEILDAAMVLAGTQPGQTD